MIPAMEYKGIHVPERPPRVIGYITKLGKILGGKNLRYFELNPIEGTFIKYMREKNYPKEPRDTYLLAEIMNLNLNSPDETRKWYPFEVNLLEI